MSILSDFFGDSKGSIDNSNLDDLKPNSNISIPIVKSQWKFDIGEHVWWVSNSELIEVLIINHKNKYDIMLDLPYDKQYLIKGLENNYCFWVKENELNTIYK